jgi:hypothetical protein
MWMVNEHKAQDSSNFHGGAAAVARELWLAAADSCGDSGEADGVAAGSLELDSDDRNKTRSVCVVLAV